MSNFVTFLHLMLAQRVYVHFNTLYFPLNFLILGEKHVNFRSKFCTSICHGSQVTVLQSWERDLKTFGLHEPSKAELEDINFTSANQTPVLVREELNYDVNKLRKLVDHRKTQFTESQQEVFETVMKSKFSLCVYTC